jgi:serine/threonine-protein kinase
VSQHNPGISVGPKTARGQSVPAGRYRVLGLLGEGGMGVVERVHDLVEDREVAQKRVLVHGNASPDIQAQLIARLQREYYTLAELSHPNIIRVHDFGIDERGPYYTMELLEGGDLRRAAPMPWREACAVVRDVAAALALLHSRRLLHRDISPRNVHRAPNGHAKLIDFGTMSPMGLDRFVAGTPPFIPPENVARQALDGRADIYALGALAYYLLTGRHAYPARTIAELPDHWRTTPRLASHYAREVAEAVDALVMQMLSLDPQARPSSAVELVERFSALAGLEQDDAHPVTAVGAYLAAPTLLGRGPALVTMRRRTLRGLRGRGASVWVSGVAGVGRSRFLDACALEAKLAGSIVLRLGRGDTHADFAGARALFEQLDGQVSESERRGWPAAALERSALRNAGGIGLPPTEGDASSGNERAAIQSALFDYLTGLAAHRPLAILADDVEDFDEPSLALLTSLGRAAVGCKLLLVAAATRDSTPRAPAPFHALAAHSRARELAPLGEAEVELLLRSLFGEIPNLSLLAPRIYRLSAGLPKLCMDLCQHLIDRGVIQSRAGGFMLQESFTIADLPDSFVEALRQRVARLGEGARWLGTTLALVGAGALGIDTCIEVSGDPDPGSVYRAFAELERVQIARLEGDTPRLAHGYAEAFIDCTPPEALRALHGRLALLFARDAHTSIRAAKHFFAAGEEQAAFDALLAYARDESAIRHWYSEQRLVLEQGIAAGTQLGRPPHEIFRLRRTLCRALTFYVEPADREELLQVARELYDLAGAGFLADASVEPDPLRNLQQALKQAFERYERLPVAERTLTPFEALAMLGSYIAGLAAYATYVLDRELLLRVPSLMPFAPLSASLIVMETIVKGLREIREDRTYAGMDSLKAAIAALRAPDHAGFEPKIAEATLAHMLNGLGMMEAGIGRVSALEHADLVEAFPDHRVNAWRIRHMLSLYRPDAARAEQCRREIERLQLQEGPRQFGEGSTLEGELLAYATADDLLGLLRIKAQMEDRAKRFPGWLPWLHVAEGECERIRRRFDRAIELHGRALELTAPGEHMAWGHCCALQLEVMIEAGRFEEARMLGTQRLELALAKGLGSMNLIRGALAVAESALGHHDRARALVVELLAEPPRLDIHGLFSGHAYERAARVAIECGDAKGFEQCYRRCYLEYGAGMYPALTARLEKLTTAARRRELIGAGAESARGTVTPARVCEQLIAAATSGERAQRALELLLEAAEASGGHIFGIRDARLELLASRSAPPPTSQLMAALGHYLRAQRTEQATVALADLPEQRPGSSGLAALQAEGRRFEPILLAGGAEHSRLAAGIAVLTFPEGRPRKIPLEIAAAISACLIASHDVTGISLAD